MGAGGIKYVGDTSVVYQIVAPLPGVLFPSKLGGGAALKTRRAINTFLDVLILRCSQIKKFGE